MPSEPPLPAPDTADSSCGLSIYVVQSPDARPASKSRGWAVDDLLGKGGAERRNVGCLPASPLWTPMKLSAFNKLAECGLVILGF